MAKQKKKKTAKGRPAPKGRRASVSRPKPKAAPKQAKAKPARKKAKPIRAKAKPTRKKVAPARAKAKPTRKKVAPVRKKVAPARAKAKPARKKVAPARAKAKPTRKKVAPVRTKAKPTRKKAAPVRAKVKPVRKKAAPTRKKPARKKPTKKPFERVKPFSKITIPQRRLLQAAEEIRKQASKRSVNQADLSRAEGLIDEATRLGKQANSERAGRAKKLVEWRKRKKKPTPSREFKASLDEWTKNHDGTESGARQWKLDDEGGSWEDFDNWLIDWEDEWRHIDEEPVWLAVGITVSGVKSQDREKYERIFGRMGIVSTWRKSTEFGGESAKGLADLLVTWREDVAKNVLEKGYSIAAWSLFVHYGPTRPNGEFFG